MNVADSIVSGFVEHAVLYFHKAEKNYGVTTESSNDTGANEALTQSAKESLRSSAVKVAAEKNKELMAKAMGNAAGNLLLSSSIANMHPMEVQFNPTTLRLSGVSGGLAPVTSYGSGSNSLDFKGLPTRVDVSFKLLFDDVEPKNAFLQDKLIPEPVDIAKAATVEALKHTSAKIASKYLSTVQDKVEGLHAAMRMRKTTEVVFAWNKTMIRGVITSLSTNYIMFAPDGNPIRATADITITCDADAVSAWFATHADTISGMKGIRTQSTSQGVEGLLNL